MLKNVKCMHKALVAKGLPGGLLVQLMPHPFQHASSEKTYARVEHYQGGGTGGYPC